VNFFGLEGMRVIEFTPDRAEPISLFESVASSAVALGHGSGEVHVYAVHFGKNSSIGAHPTGFCQLFLVVQGSGWAAGQDGRRVNLRVGQGVFFERGEMHSKGSDTGMIALMVQGTQIDPTPEALADGNSGAP
jgi:hypothetical protein